MAPRHTLRTLIASLVIAAVALATGGCGGWDWRGSGFGTNDGRWARRMRPPADEKSFSGVDTRAREIEGNLGVR